MTYGTKLKVIEGNCDALCGEWGRSYCGVVKARIPPDTAHNSWEQAGLESCPSVYYCTPNHRVPEQNQSQCQRSSQGRGRS
ncbi:hypothetical protein J6590_065045 [Homalodisca vitripennis]|nr:hypothetical protein J6590_065045 [Homalodisca vitripennis]